MAVEPMGADPAAAGRIRRLTQAALNADVTIGRVDGLVSDLGEVVRTVNWLLSPVHVAREQLCKLSEVAVAASALIGALANNVLLRPISDR